MELDIDWESSGLYVPVMNEEEAVEQIGMVLLQKQRALLNMKPVCYQQPAFLSTTTYRLNMRNFAVSQKKRIYKIFSLCNLLSQ